MKDKILTLVDKIHNLRVANNRDDIGLGIDKYQPESKFYYDEAYALWGLGYLNLYKLKSHISDLSRLDLIAEYFHKQQRYDGSFGLPWEWLSQRKEEGYLITTAFAGFFLLKYNTLFKKEHVEILIHQIQDYLLSLEENRDSRIYLRYSKYLNEDVLNAYAVALLFLALYNYSRNQDLIEQLVNNIKYGQADEGGFIYMLYPQRKIDLPDNYHQCFILNSLLRLDDYLRKNHATADYQLNKIIEKGLSYFISNFYDDDLYLRRHAKEPLLGKCSFQYRKLKSLWTVGRLKRRLLRQPPSRSRPIFEDFGQTLALLARNGHRYSHYLESTVNQVQKELKSIKPGNFYIRGLGHVFYGLTEVLVNLDMNA